MNPENKGKFNVDSNFHLVTQTPSWLELWFTGDKVEMSHKPEEYSTAEAVFLFPGSKSCCLCSLLLDIVVSLLEGLDASGGTI